MTWPGPLHALRIRLRALLGRDALDTDLGEEQRFHLERLAEVHERAGASRDDAQRRARLAFGNPLALRETSREAFSFVRLEGLVHELRYALRRLRRAPGFTAVAVLTLALGIGMNAALFSVLDAALLRPLPYAEPERLLALSEPGPQGEGDAVAFANLADYAVPALWPRRPRPAQRRPHRFGRTRDPSHPARGLQLLRGPGHGTRAGPRLPEGRTRSRRPGEGRAPEPHALRPPFRGRPGGRGTEPAARRRTVCRRRRAVRIVPCPE